MNLVDKILLVLLVLMLPLGLGISYLIYTHNQEDKTDESLLIQQQKLDNIANQLSAQNQSKKPKSFSIGSIKYASSSGSLEISGKAPGEGASVLISATVLPVDEQGVDKIKGSQVTTVSIVPEIDKSFIYQFPTRQKKGIVELRLVQNESVTTIHYDLEKKEQVQ